VALPSGGARLVFAHVDLQDPRPFHRAHGGVFVVSLLRLTHPPEHLDAHAQAWLVRTLGNLMIIVAGPEESPQTYLRTLDRGLERITAPAWSRGLYAALLERIALFDVHLVMDNIFDRDLEPELHDGGRALPALRDAARRLYEAGALASGLQMGEELSHQEQRHLERLFQGSRISFGNLSLRQDAQRFWMSASGVDWAGLEAVGKDVQLVKGYDAASRALLVSVPPGVRPRRVSPDALTHPLIYRAHRAVGAIAHVHAWLQGVTALAPDYARGSLERAQAVAALVRQAEDPVHAVVGIERHGLILTGEDLDDILRRVAGRDLLPVPE
jgi:ribulose-5-phosphate 4-epimerase/fuculose-1-phosphate aldolase